MLDKEGTVELTDFKLAKFLDKDLTESIGGTPPYMAPEAWKGHHYPATDQWSLALIAVECSQAPIFFTLTAWIRFAPTSLLRGG